MTLPPAVVLLHGQPGHGADWDPVLPLLDGLQILTPTRPGYDGTPAGGFGVNAAAVLRLLDRAELDQAVVIGHSWGGGVALRLALDAPDRVLALGLLGSVGSSKALTLTDRLLAAPVLRGGSARAADRLGTRMARITEAASGSRLGRAARASLRETMQGLSHEDWVAYAVEQHAFVREAPALARQLGEIRVPAVVTVGRRDVIVSPRAQRDLADRLPRAELIEHRGGHLVQLECPDVVARTIRRAVERATTPLPDFP